MSENLEYFPFKKEPTSIEIVSYVKEFFKKQNSLAIGLHGGCYYKTPDGEKCPIGCLIPDESYHPSMEDKDIYDLLCSTNQKNLPKYFADNEDLLNHLQRKHDESNSLKYFLDSLEQLEKDMKCQKKK